MTEFVQSFKFRVRLTRSTSAGPTQTSPPDLTGSVPRTRPGAGSGGGGAGRARLVGGGFQECGGLDLEADIHEYLEGGRNDGIVRRVGRVKLQPIVLKRGIITTTDRGYADPRLWQWLQSVVGGVLPLPRYDGTIEVLDPSGSRVTARWTFTRSLPSKVTGPQLNAKTGEIAIEELHLQHEGLRMEATS